jgi:Plasmid pRiA4b ORF-3-like protein
MAEGGERVPGESRRHWVLQLKLSLRGVSKPPVWRRLLVPPDFLAEPGDRIRYAYDFGDFWEHDIVLEKMLEPDPDVRLPACVAGKGACPPEDCGGAWGYADLRDTLANPASEEHDAMLEWLGLDSADDFDPTAFDVDETNDILGMATASRR